LHNPNDEINDGKRYLDKTIIEYRIGHNKYDLFTIGDYFKTPYIFEDRREGNIVGELAERISRRLTKYFLQHFSKHGHTGGIFDKRFDPQNRDNFIIANTEGYILKIQKYPNLIILKKSGKGKFGYENIKELDGLFDYRYHDTRHIIVLESKVDKVNIVPEELKANLFTPLREIFPRTIFSYVLFSSADAIFVKKTYSRRRRLRQLPVKLYETLAHDKIGTLFFTFNESRADFDRMKNHLITQYRSIAHLGIEFYGKMQISHREIILFTGGETPHMKLVKDKSTGFWREVSMWHKQKKKKKVKKTKK